MSINRVLVTFPFEAEDGLIIALQEYIKNNGMHQVSISKAKKTGKEIDYTVWLERNGECFELTKKEDGTRPLFPDESLQLNSIGTQMLAFIAGWSACLFKINKDLDKMKDKSGEID